MAGNSPEIKIAKVKKARANASVAGQETAKGQNIPRRDQQYWNQSISVLRDTGQTMAAVRQLARVDGTTSAAVFYLTQVAMSNYRVSAYDPATNEFSQEGTSLAESVMASLDTLWDYTEGFADKASIDTLVQTMLRESAITDAVCAELVLDKAFFPDRITTFSYETITWAARGDGRRYPKQANPQGGETVLDFPTVVIAENARDADNAYTRSMYEAALTMAFYFDEFIEDMRRAMRRVGHSRMRAKLILDTVKLSAPREVANDANKLRAYLEEKRQEVETILSNLEPEDALVHYDTAEIATDRAEQDKADYSQLMEALSGMLSTALKASPSILGLRLAGSQSLSNTESLIFLKAARYIQIPVETAMSRLLTLAVRLLGSDVYVHFAFDPIDLRPANELEAFKVMQLDRVTTLLSLGFISDEEAAQMLGTGPRPAGAPPLSGTMFKDVKAVDVSKASPNNGAQEKAMQPDTPSKSGGKQP